MEDLEYVFSILHDIPNGREAKCRYYPEQDCLYDKEDEEGRNWCNNCFAWHFHLAGKFGVRTVYSGKPDGCQALHASMVKILYE